MPNYFFRCPQCGKLILVAFDWEQQVPGTDPVIEGLTCMKIGTPRGCGWAGNLSASQGYPILKGSI